MSQLSPRSPSRAPKLLILAAALGALAACDSSTDSPSSTGIITVSSPKAGASYKAGDSLTVSWTVKQDPNKVVDAADIFFSPDAGQNWKILNGGSIPPASAKWGNFKWLIPDSLFITSLNKYVVLKGLTTCQIRVEEYSTQDPDLKTVTGNFTISP